MKQMMFVGVPCSGCKHNLILGKTEIEPSSPPSLLHLQLRQEGWKEDMEATCLLEKCGTKTGVGLNKTILLRPVDEIAEGVES